MSKTKEEPQVQAQDVTTAASKGAEEPKQEPSETPEQKLAKAEQQLQQERANARKARERLQGAEAQLEQLETQNTQFAEQLEEVQRQLKEELSKKQFQQLADLDPERTDVPDLVKAYHNLVQKVQQQEARIGTQEKFIQSMQTQSQQTQEVERRTTAVNRILAACDDEFGAQYRNEATKLADSWVDDGDEPAPSSEFDGYRLMRRAYAQIAKDAEARKVQQQKPAVPTDTGLRGPTSHLDLEPDEHKAGTLDQVADDLRRKMKAGTWKRAFG